ncbi:MAG TPA: hypothetical protein VKJ07_22130 [Mycobacteriales bacterium]|nr:hypothetical protein [Mycobacteriales bacterium]
MLQILSTNAKAAAIAGIAIAATAGGGAVVATTVADSSPTTTTVTSPSTGSGDDANEPTEVKESDSPDAEDAGKPSSDTSGSADSTDTTVTPTDCGTTAWANHGAYVSSVAHSTPSAGVSRGDLVSAAAQSDCGKPTPNSTDAPDSPKAKPTHSPQGDSHRNSNATTHKSATHGKSAAHKHH